MKINFIAFFIFLNVSIVAAGADPNLVKDNSFPLVAETSASSFIGSWFFDNLYLAEESYFKILDRDIMALRLEKDGEGFYFRGDSDIGKIRWKQTSPDIINIKWFYLTGTDEIKYQEFDFQYNKKDDRMYRLKGPALLRRMKRNLPSRARKSASTSNTFIGYWTSELNHLNVMEFSFEADGTGTLFSNGVIMTCLKWDIDKNNNISIHGKDCEDSWKTKILLNKLDMIGRYDHALDAIQFRGDQYERTFYHVGNSITEICKNQIDETYSKLNNTVSIKPLSNTCFTSAVLARQNLQYYSKDKKSGLKMLEASAKTGLIVEDQYILGKIFYFGRDWLRADHEEGVRWIRTAAANGDIAATIFMERVEETRRREICDNESINYNGPPLNSMEMLYRCGIKYDEETFFKYIDKGNAKLVTLFLSAGMSPNIKGDKGNTALTSSLMYADHQSVALELIRAGADPNVSYSSQEITPLMMAVLHGDLEVTKALIAAGANVNATDKRGYAVMKYVEMNTDMKRASDIIQLLKQAGGH